MYEWDQKIKDRAGREDCPVPEGFETRLSERLSELPVRRRKGLNRGRGILLAAALCAALAVTAVALSPTLQEHLAAALGGFGPYAQTVEGVTATDRGLRVRVVSALSDSRNVRLYIAVEDLTGDRLDENLQMEYALKRPVEAENRIYSGGSGYGGGAKDPETGAVLLTVTGREDSRLAGGVVTLEISAFTLGDGTRLVGAWTLTTELETLAERIIPLEGTTAPERWQELRLSPLCMSLDIRTEAPERDELWGQPVTLTLTDGTALSPAMESSGWGIYYANGGRETYDAGGMGMGVSTWVFEQPLDPEAVAAIAIGDWSVDLTE